ncbi:hypothetical protein V8G54_026634 [Vigna mungo]|uniref:Uncharacterized protein n=1 Tax=Vigna mungo TaxID=3915 RepID=A0AAQ3N0W7_VIGMU
MVCAISLAASIFLSVINAGLLAIACPISWALFASPCSLKIRNESQGELNTYKAKRGPIRTTVNSKLYKINLNTLKLDRQICSVAQLFPCVFFSLGDWITGVTLYYKYKKLKQLLLSMKTITVSNLSINNL